MNVPNIPLNDYDIHKNLTHILRVLDDVEDDRALESPGFEVDFQVEREVGDAHRLEVAGAASVVKALPALREGELVHCQYKTGIVDTVVHRCALSRPGADRLCQFFFPLGPFRKIAPAVTSDPFCEN